MRAILPITACVALLLAACIDDGDIESIEGSEHAVSQKKPGGGGGGGGGGKGNTCNKKSCICEAGFGNCDADHRTGCEVDLRGNPDHCGACGVACAPEAMCATDGDGFLCVCGDGYEGDGFTCTAMPTGSSLYFNGVNAMATIANTNGLHMAGMSWTQEAWVKPTVDSTWIRFIWAKKRAHENLGWTGEWKANNHVAATNLATPNFIMPIDQWSHVAITFDDATGEKCIWINGDAAVCGHVPAHQGLNARPVTLGNEEAGIDATYFAGYVDELRFSSVVRYTAPFTAETVFAPDAATIGLWHFDEGGGTTFASELGDMTGTLSNAVFSSDVP